MTRDPANIRALLNKIAEEEGTGAVAALVANVLFAAQHAAANEEDPVLADTFERAGITVINTRPALFEVTS